MINQYSTPIKLKMNLHFNKTNLLRSIFNIKYEISIIIYEDIKMYEH
jgi:hypothetical protein